MNYPVPQQRPLIGQSPGFMSRMNQFRNNNRDSLIQFGLGLMTGRNAAEQMTFGAQGLNTGLRDAREAREKQAKLNQTVEFLEQVNPTLAQAVKANVISASEAYGHHVRAQTASNTGDKFDAYGFPRSGAISQKIRAYQMQGIDEDKALGLATGRYSVSINPQTGERVIVDVASNQIIPLQQPLDNEQATTLTAQVQPAQDGLYNQATDATGVGSTMGNVLSNTIGQIPGAIGNLATFPNKVEAVQEFELFKRDLIRSLSLNPKFPISEQQRIENLVPRGALTSPATLKQSLRSLNANLARIEAEALERINDPQTPITQRQQDMVTLQGVQAARRRIAFDGQQPPLSQQNGGAVDLKAKYGLE